MAKKSRRVRRKPRLSESQLVQPVDTTAQTTSPEVEKVAPAPEKRSEAVDFQDEYRYVVSDLQRIGLLAAVMLGGLIILSFIL